MLSVKWVTTNKGTPKAPVPKARFVARENASALDRDTLFSVAIARSLISKAASARRVGKTLRGLGCTETKGAPGVYYHKEKDVEVTLHVDDFLVVGEEEHLLELNTALGKVYKLKGKVLGPDEGDSKEGVYLERRLQW